ncbi:MAG: Eco57I restriction-modification methylase domain-containing protein [Bacilli bacterium]|nr:Eco57I restriction-modification methylase domain-containing protein [Bacilli bacterium]
MASKASKQKDNTINIHSYPVQMHVGSQKFVNDDWGTMAYIIDRREIQNKFADPELRYNCIYFLFGYENNMEMCYVGQAKIRNDGESVLARLREHDKSTTEKYCDVWDWAVVVTNKNGSWTLDDLNALEHAFYAEIPVEQNLNGNNPNAGGADFDSYIDKIEQIKKLVTTIGFSIFAEKVETENIQVISETNEFSIVEDLQNGMARIPEIVTPHKVVKAMVDMLPADVWNDKTVFLDPACKGGEYLREIYDRLMENEVMQSKYDNPIERSNHILSEQLYGIALSQVSLERTTKKLMGFGMNIRVIPSYIEILKTKFVGEVSEADKREYIMNILNKEFGKTMNIDVVIGNPPYQKDSERGTQGAVSIYTLFMELANNILSNNKETAICSMIVPARWICNAGSRGIEESWVKKEIKSNKYRKIHIEEDSKRIFNGVDIKGGIMYYIKDMNYSGKCIVSNESRYLDDAGIGKFIQSAIEANILKKVTNISKKYMNEIVSSYSPFGLQSNVICKTTGDIKLHRTRGEIEHVSIEDIPKGHDILSKYKVFVPLSYGDGKKGEVLNNIKVVGPNEACTSTYVSIYPTDDIDIAKNIAKYLHTRLFNLLIGEIKVTQSASKEVYQLVPLQDFTNNSDIDWSQSIADIDKQLYKKYGLSQEEIDYIEKTIKPME